MTIALVCIVAGMGIWLYVPYLYQTYIVGQYHKYPEPVAKKLRRAIYYSKIDVNVPEALKYFEQALEVAREEGMHPMSDEVMGIKIEIAGLMERIHSYGEAIKVLDVMVAQNLEWIEAHKDDEELKKLRTRVLYQTVKVQIKVAELYGNPAIWDRDTAEAKLVWAVETLVKEKQRREREHVTDEEEGPWLSDDEMGASIEELAQLYSGKNQHYLAVPLYLQALAVKPTTDCHTVILMSNLASSLAQQSPRAARAAQAYAQSRNIQSVPSGPIATKEQMLDNACLWAEKALSLGRQIQPPQRSEECDVGCVVATHNLGEIAEMLGNKQAAIERYTEAVSLAKGIGYQEGLEMSSGRLRDLKKISNS
jgi:tetratricopeptide (TPR) repeat protein